MKHVPGPYNHKKKDPGFGTVYSYEIWADHYPVKQANLLATVTGRGYLSDEIVEATARLFATSPALFEALEWLVSFHDDLSPWAGEATTEWADAIAFAKEKIAKVKGK